MSIQDVYGRPFILLLELLPVPMVDIKVKRIEKHEKENQIKIIIERLREKKNLLFSETSDDYLKINDSFDIICFQ